METSEWSKSRGARAKMRPTVESRPSRCLVLKRHKQPLRPRRQPKCIPQDWTTTKSVLCAESSSAGERELESAYVACSLLALFKPSLAVRAWHQPPPEPQLIGPDPSSSMAGSTPSLVCRREVELHAFLEVISSNGSLQETCRAKE